MTFNRFLTLTSIAAVSAMLAACSPENQGKLAAAAAAASAASSSSSSSVGYSGVNAFQIIPKEGATGSFDATAVPGAGGIAIKAQRIFALDGSQISTGSVPSWFSESKIFLTSTRTSGGAPAYAGSDTPCAYFDSYSDNNPDSNGYYTIDGYSVDGTTVLTDIDQCAGTNATELNSLSAYVKVDRRFMNASDKLQVIVKAKLVDAPNTSPTVSTCVVGGNFDPAACSNQYFALTLRTAPAASAQPFYVLFPSAKARDLLSETILLPLQIDSGITTVSIDRVKGGIVLYGITVIRLL